MWQHRIWLYSPRCGARATKHTGYCRDRPRATVTQIASMLLPPARAYHQCTMRSDAGFALPADQSFQAPSPMTPRCNRDLCPRISSRASRRCCNGQIEQPASSTRSQSAARHPNRRSSVGRLRQDGSSVDRSRRTASLPRRPAAPYKRKRIRPLSGFETMIPNAIADTTIIGDIVRSFVTNSSVIVAQFSVGVITNSPL